MSDVTNPDHYRSHASGVECITVTEHFGFCIGNAIKYLWRADLKHDDGGLEDLRKAAWYIDREIKRREAANTPDHPTTPEPETSPAKPGSRDAQQGLRVGARVRAVTEDTYNGLMGVIVEGTERWFSVKLDTNMITTPRDFSDHELVVIG